MQPVIRLEEVLRKTMEDRAGLSRRERRLLDAYEKAARFLAPHFRRAMSAAADCQEALEDLAAAVESSEAAAAFKARGNLRAALSGDFRNSAWLLLAFIIPAIDSNSPGDCRRPG